MKRVGENLVKAMFMSVPTPFGQDCSCARFVKQHSHSLDSSSRVKGWVYNDWSTNLWVCVGFL